MILNLDKKVWVMGRLGGMNVRQEREARDYRKVQTS